MMKHILATSALATLLATGLNAQTDPAADQDPAAPVVEETEGAMDEPIVEGAEGTMDGSPDLKATTSPDVVENAPDVPAPDVAEETAPMENAADPMVAEPAEPMEAEDSMVAEPTETTEAEDPMVAEPAETMEAEDPMVAEPAETMETVDPTVAGDWAPIDLSTISTDQLIGADIVTHNNETIATIEDVLISDDGQVENIVARFGGFLGFGANRVLLTPDELEVMQEADESLLVRTDLTPESIEERPVYEDEAVEG